MFSLYDFPPETSTLILSFLSVVAASDMSTPDKAEFARAIIYVGQTILFEATLELREQAQLQAQEQVGTLEKQIDTLNEQMEEIKKRLKN